MTKAIRLLVSQVEKLEAAYGPKAQPAPYVIRTADPPTDSEIAQMQVNAIAGRPFARMPYRCTSAAEWLARYAPHP